MSRSANAEFLTSPSNGQTPNIIRIPTIIPAQWNPETAQWQVDPTRAKAMLQEVVSQTWAGYELNCLFSTVNISVDFKKKRIRVSYDPADDSLGYMTNVQVTD
jgi:hypothetical protein